MFSDSVHVYTICRVFATFRAQSRCVVTHHDVVRQLCLSFFLALSVCASVTSGGVVLMKVGFFKQWRLVALSSCEAGLFAIDKGAAEATGMLLRCAATHGDLVRMLCLSHLFQTNILSSAESLSGRLF